MQQLRKIGGLNGETHYQSQIYRLYLIVITALSSLCAVYIFGEYRTLQENLNQTTLELNNASDRLAEAYERIDEQSEERAENIQVVLHYYDLWIEYWEGLGVQPGDLAIKSDISPLYSFVIVYPETRARVRNKFEERSVSRR